ncbi:DUF1579 family protein [Leptolyngbya sp. 7M]|uniref:DUF1579 family protein n=1 Tax=Leptolyngbya sp. 7M TaxID=2812896 RepID=UPI001B8C50C4|nr:DUF1579 family protein [Leptolyngbya sp. 7M]QYO65500.1 DUF1579 domain-containing protein [Leptolyngbya sp. 7M]
MSIHTELQKLAGQWSGTNKLNLSWMPDPIKESASTATVTERVSGQCLEIAYRWEYEGEPQEGLIIINGNGGSNAVNAFWTDSWHSKNVLMACEGSVSENGAVNIKGHYSVPDHPDWGWRTEIIPNGDTFKYLMFNVSPEGVEEWAVETEFARS